MAFANDTEAMTNVSKQDMLAFPALTVTFRKRESSFQSLLQCVSGQCRNVFLSIAVYKLTFVILPV